MTCVILKMSEISANLSDYLTVSDYGEFTTHYNMLNNH